MIFYCYWLIRLNLGNESLIINVYLSKLIFWVNVSIVEILINIIYIYYNVVLFIGFD